jgi:hypothetical protein
MNKTSTHSYGLFEYLVYQREGSFASSRGSLRKHRW